MPYTRYVVTCALSIACAASVLSAQGLVANAGPDQSGVFVGTTVNLSGSASVGASSYTWTFVTRPAGSAAVLATPNQASASFVPDKRGTYTVLLTVGNGTATTATDTVIITTGNRAPVANGGPDAVGTVTDLVSLSGAGSTDLDGDKLTYTWSLVSAPPASLGVLTNANRVTSKLTLDRPGSYVVALVVRDGQLSSAPDTVTVTTINTPPVSNAGPDRRIANQSLIQLDGTASSDVDEDALTYAWTLKRPSGSTAILNDPSSPMPSFFADKLGNYTATLIVSDGVSTHKDVVVLATTANIKPVARSGPDGPPLTLGTTVQFDGSGSTDAGGQLLNYAWSITKRPSGSTAVLTAPNTPRPMFTADKAGKYTFSQTVTDQLGLASTDTRIFTTAFPRADAGPDQEVTAGSVVTLDGSASSHLTQRVGFGWALVSVPIGSTATLDDPSEPQPRFVADVAGTYIAQLILFDGAAWSPADTVVVTSDKNLAPVVEMGPNRLVATGAPITLDALATDPNLDPITFAWTLLSRPAASAAALSGVSGPSVQITPDQPGDYIVQVTGTDSAGLSSMDTLTLTTGNTAPAVVAEDDRLVAAGHAVVAVADAEDPDGGPITYEWRMLRRPAGSSAALSSATSASASFTPDAVGAYVVQVIVRDAFNLFAIDSVVYRVPSGVNEPPVANAGADQVVAVGGLAQLSGAASADPESQPLSYAWQFLSKPLGSAAVLSSDSSVNPTFTPDVSGSYELQLVVNDGVQDSAADSVVVQTPLLLSLAPGAIAIATSATAGLTVSIAYPAPSDLLVQLGSSNTAIATVPPAVTILEGTTSANFNVTGGTTSGGVVVKASAVNAGTTHATVAVGTRLVQWTDDVSGSWEDATKWTDDIAPGPGDVVVIDRPAGNFTVTVGTATAAVASIYATEQLIVPSTLTVNGAAAFAGGLTLSGTLAGAGSVAINSPMTWQSGVVSLAGGLEVLHGRTLTFTENGQGRTLANTALRNHGTIAQGTNNPLVMQGGTTVAVINESDGLWTMGDNTIHATGAGTHSFSNLGTLRKLGGPGQMWLTGHFQYVNNGTIDIQAGSLAVGLGGYSATLLNTGTINAAPGTTILLQQMTLAPGTSFTGAGQLHVNASTTLTANLTLTQALTITGTLAGAGALHMAAPLTWQSGVVSLTGGLEILNGRVLTFTENGQGRTLSDTTLRNHGTIAQGTNNPLVMQGGTTVAVINESDGLWTMGDNTIHATGAGTHSFSNLGTLRKLGGPGQMWLTGHFQYVNNGTIDIQAGSLAVGLGGYSATLLNTGTINAATGTTILLQQMTLAPGTSFTGTGTLHLNANTTVTANLTLGLPTELSGTVAGSGALHMAAPLTWHSGVVSLTGGLEILNGRVLTFTENGQGRTLSNTTLRNHGTIAQGTNNPLVLQGGTTVAVINESDGLWTMGDNTIYATGAGTHSFANLGSLRKVTGTGQMWLTGHFEYTSSGTIRVQSGSFAVGLGGYGATLLNTGTINASAGATVLLQQMTLAPGTSFAGTGTLKMNANTTVTGDVTIALPTELTGTLMGSGTVRMSGPMTWATGTLSLAGGLEILATGSLNLGNTGQSHSLTTGTSLRNYGAVTWPAAGNIQYTGGSVTVRNESGATWTFGSGSFSVATNGAPTPPASFTFVNAGSMTGAGNASTSLFVGNQVVFSNTGSIANLTLTLQP